MKKWFLYGAAATVLIGGAPAVQAATSHAEIAQYDAAARRGDAEAQFKLGVCFYNGDGVPKDHRQAAYWFRLAADRGHEIGRASCRERVFLTV